MTATDGLTALYERHLSRNNRRPETAISLASARTLWTLLEERAPANVLELGSGFSSTVIRSWTRQHRNWVMVYTTDTEWKWLGATMHELEVEGFDTRHLLHHDIFARLPEAMTKERFEVVFLDLADTDTRARWVPRVVEWLRPDGLLILDDWHMPHYRERATAALVEHGFAITPLPETTDEFGRFMATAERRS